MGEPLENERSLVPGGETGVAPFEGHPLTRFAESFPMPPHIHQPLIPLSEEQKMLLTGYYNAARQNFDNLNLLTQQTGGRSPWQAITAASIREVFDSVRRAQEAGLQVVPSAAEDLTVKQSILTERLIQLLDEKARTGSPDWLEEEWIVNVHREALGALGLQLERSLAFLKEGYLSEELATSSSPETREIIQRLNEAHLNVTFENLIKFCLYPPVFQNSGDVARSGGRLREVIVSTFAQDPPLALSLLEKWQSTIAYFDYTMIGKNIDKVEKLNQADSFLALTRSYADTLGILLKLTGRPPMRQYFQKVAQTLQMSDFEILSAPTIFTMVVESTRPLSAVQKRMRGILEKMGWDHLKDRNSRPIRDFEEEQKMAAYLIRLALYDRDNEEREEKLDQYVVAFAQRVSPEERVEHTIRRFGLEDDPDESAEDDKGSDEEEPEEMSEEEAEAEKYLRQVDEQEQAEMNRMPSDVGPEVIEEICTFLTASEARKFKAIGW